MKFKLIAPIFIISALALTGCAVDGNLEPGSGGTSQSPSPSPSATETPVEEFTNPGTNENRELKSRSLRDWNGLNAALKATVETHDNNNAFIQTETSGEDKISYILRLGENTEGAIYMEYSDGSTSVAPLFPEMLESFSTASSYFRIDLLSYELDAVKNILSTDALPAEGIPGAEAYEAIATSTGYEFISPISSYKVSVEIKDGLVSKITESDKEKVIVEYNFSYTWDAEYDGILSAAVFVPNQ